MAMDLSRWQAVLAHLIFSIVLQHLHSVVALAATHVVGTLHENVTLFCNLDISDPPKIDWYDHKDELIYRSDWTYIEKDATFREQLFLDVDKPQELVIMNVTTENVVPFYCESWLRNGHHSGRRQQAKTFEVEVAEPLNCMMDKIRYTSNDNATLSCDVKIHRKLTQDVKDPQITWYRGPIAKGHKIKEALNWTDAEGLGSTTHAQYTFNPDGREDGKVYTCLLIYFDYRRECTVTLSVSGGGIVNTTMATILEMALLAMFQKLAV